MDVTKAMEMTKKASESKDLFSVGINFNGNATIGNISHSQAVANGLTYTAKNTVARDLGSYYYHLTGDEHSSDYTRALCSTGIWNDGAFSIRYPVPNGRYLTLFYVLENYKDYCRTFKIRAPGWSDLVIPKMRKGYFYIARGHIDVVDGYAHVDVIPIDNPEVHLMSMSIIESANP